ncbi:pyridoxamine 5'-phosphate oxidase family protein [Streptomyces pathocidini]|uniref:pyridoxamine 5'-phosphate oxidase family protein n=1 Tax=Streptomyces pathocidini TaxID=1650571 RepID=UPI00340ECE0E
MVDDTAGKRNTADRQPRAEVNTDYSEAEAVARPWPEVAALLEEAELFWISTVRPDGRPHVTPLPAVWLDGSLHFCTGAEERKGRNLAENPETVLTTGNNTWDRGYDVVVEGAAVRVTDDARLRVLAAAWEAKYGEFWHFEAHDGYFHHGRGRAVVYEVSPRTVFGFGKGSPFSQTRWRFA